MAKWQASSWLGVLNHRWLRTLLLLILLVVLAQVLAKTLWMVFAGPIETVTPASGLMVMGQANQTSNTVITQQVAKDWALFGTSTPVKSNNSAGEDAPETRLKLTLLAVFAHQGDELDGAVIAKGSGEGKLYRPGDELPGHASLYKVLPNKVLLKRLGRTESLSFETQGLNGSIESVQQPVAPSPQTKIQKQRVMVINTLGLVPVNTGQAAGYKVTSKIKDIFSAQTGLKPGDRILSVNGMPIGTPAADDAAIRSFYNKGKATVVIQRGSSQLTFTYPP